MSSSIIEYHYADFTKVKKHPRGPGNGKWVYKLGIKSGSHAHDGTILNCFSLPLRYRAEQCNKCGDEQVHLQTGRGAYCVRCNPTGRQGRLFHDRA